jgi:hypothetical protein
MNLYNDDLQLDHDKAAAEVRATPAISSAEARRERYAELQSAALVDIADSLRTLAVEAAISMARNGDLAPDADHGFEAPESVAIIDAPAGTRITTASGDVGILTGESGVTEGAAWVGVLFTVQTDVDDVEEYERRVWATDVMTIDPSGEEPTGLTIADLAAAPVPLVGVATEDEAPELLDERGTDEDGEPAVGGYDLDDLADDALARAAEAIDADFEVPPTDDDHSRAEAAVAALKAREKKAKKGGKR